MDLPFDPKPLSFIALYLFLAWITTSVNDILPQAWFILLISKNKIYMAQFIYYNNILFDKF